MDVNNLSKEVISDYQIVDSNYSILPQFRNIRSVRLATGQFAGFPTSVIDNNVLYCFYYQAAAYASTPVNYNHNVVGTGIPVSKIINLMYC